MKKLLSILFIVCMVFSVVSVQADSVRDNALGNPILNVDDTAILKKYPGVMQKFPNSIFAFFDGTGDYAKYGVAYKASDMLGLLFSYENNVSTINQQFRIDGALQDTATLYQVANIIYGAKLGEMLAGFSAKTHFIGNEILKTTSINTNAVEFKWVGFSGFQTTFAPSLSLGLAGLNVYATLDTTLNFTKWYTIETNNSKWYDYSTPAMLKNIGINALITKEMNETTLVGCEIIASKSDDGYTYQQITNSADTHKTNAYVGGTTSASLGLGARVKATESVFVFVDVVAGLSSATGLHQKDADKGSYNITTVWTLPAVTLGSEFELVKNLKLRISAKPSQTITTIKLASYDNINADTTFNSLISAFNVASEIGLGYKIGSFYINWDLDTMLINTLGMDPISFIDITGHSGIAPTFSSSFQVNYVF